MPTTRSATRSQTHKPTTDTVRKRSVDKGYTATHVKRRRRSKQETQAEEAKEPTVLEKGIIYFFYRGRVGVGEPHGIEEVARSYIVLRPLQGDVKFGENPLDETGGARLLLLPKKTLPKRHGDRFIMFVEKAACPIKDLREIFSRSEHVTKTSRYFRFFCSMTCLTRHSMTHVPSATPFAEGVYSISSKDQQSHLTYQIKFPEIGEVQDELGVHEKGRFVVSAKNPKYPGPRNVPIANPPSYSGSTQKKFKGLRWIPLTPELLDYDNTQVLVVGESLGIKKTAKARKNVEEATKRGADKQEPQVSRGVA
jgi:hypothetical protein